MALILNFSKDGDLFHTVLVNSATSSGTYILGGQSSFGGFYADCKVASVLVLNAAPDIHKMIDY